MAIRSKSDSVFATFFMSMAVGRQKVTAITLPLSLSSSRTQSCQPCHVIQEPNGNEPWLNKLELNSANHKVPVTKDILYFHINQPSETVFIFDA